MDVMPPVKLFAAILYREETALSEALMRLTKAFGEIDYRSSPYPFDVTDYYKAEMGEPLFRVLVSFAPLSQAETLPEAKWNSIDIENNCKGTLTGCTVNIDIGYLDYDKVVLASTKKGAYKIAMQRNIWADMILHFEKGTFVPFSWSFADFKDNRYEKALLRIREMYKKARHLIDSGR